ncbi:hypothetical protein L0U85_15535 [Glycomyces sp. L485]|uniref:hypothetical protein n=1 Tax=Glycomyces sp. L485 TaxID=2909235 RepID=UPI001F4A4DB7|nr:hypothetical protein [Glycomyces sp. L485]MCH7232255.1 hypothetical protein [Glycomyces sp. L485]
MCYHLHERVRRRLRSLASLELINIPLQAAVWFGLLRLPPSAANLAGFCAFALLLVQGAAYWTAKLRQLESGSPTLPLAAAFALAFRVNPPVLFAVVLFVCWSALDAPGTASFPGLGFALFAALEHVNYFHTQLAYDNMADLRYLTSRGLRRSHLAVDLERHRGARVRY